MPRRAVSILAALVLMVAACGGDGEAGALTKAEWVAAANGICVEMFRELDSIPEPETQGEAGEAGIRVTEIHRAALADLRALEPPAGEQARVAQILDAAQAVIEWGSEFTEALAAGEEDRAGELLAEGERLVDEADGLFGDYGLQDCLESEE